MTLQLLIAVLATLSALLVWQLGKLWRWHLGRAGNATKTASADQLAAFESVPSIRANRERKRDLKALNVDDKARDRGGDLNASIYSDVEEKLTRAFELYEDGSISIDGYEAIVRIEGKVVHRKRSELKAREMSDNFSAASLDTFRQDVEAAEVAIQWCLDWAAERRKADQEQQPDSSQG